MTAQSLNSYAFLGTNSYRFLGISAETDARDTRDAVGTSDSLASKLSVLARQVRERALEEIRYRRTLRELSHLSDRDLNDLGLGRADLPTVARRHACAREGTQD